MTFEADANGLLTIPAEAATSAGTLALALPPHGRPPSQGGCDLEVATADAICEHLRQVEAAAGHDGDLRVGLDAAAARATGLPLLGGEAAAADGENGQERQDGR